MRKHLEGSDHGLIKILFKHLPGGTEENHQVLGEDSRCCSWDSDCEEK